MRLELDSNEATDYIGVTLSERNVLSLLHKLRMEGSAREIQMQVKGTLLSVKVENDDEHYANRPAPGPMHPDTEQFVEDYQPLPYIVRELDTFTGQACLVQYKGKHYAVSSTSVLGQPETLVFECDEQGRVTEWGEVAGGRAVTRHEAILDLAQRV